MVGCFSRERAFLKLKLIRTYCRIYNFYKYFWYERRPWFIILHSHLQNIHIALACWGWSISFVNRFCEERAFQHHLHNLMLLDSLKSCLRLAEDNDQLASTDIEALYLLFSLEDHEPLLRAVNVNRKKK